MDFTVIKCAGQGSFKVKKGTIDKLLFLLKTISIYPSHVSIIQSYGKGENENQEMDYIMKYNICIYIYFIIYIML